ncbi:duffy binding-like merozoite surface protein, putative [Plasmodium sp. gorilla clade G2]|uniref:duffy binding-like merozoite surface protein, putative n=1 Tax=Plasmodium sp. gorilla clade G2 TaxID=880535 RepID=UPI000D21BAA1|nr:duffy binding-like merozoite surface protein, putative [Plasmodium sp. gorilla clade G2]SOV15234.1 duffy binding-like merozoite surface protein, putative [Plasmodium sp. gorilla clade G2]
MKKIYSIFSFLLILNIYKYLKNVECNDIINYSGLNLRNGLPPNSLDLTNGLNNRNESIIDSKIEVHENNFYQNKDNTISVVGQDVPTSSEASSKIINANDSEGNNIDNTRGLSVTDSGIPDGGAFGGGLSVSENSPLQGGLNKCPIDKFCNGINTIRKCLTRTYEERNDTWTFIDVQTENAGLIVPPRRRKLCLGDISNRIYGKSRDDKLKNLKNELSNAAFTETASIFRKHEKQPENIFSAMKYSFADIADIIKGNDMIDNIISKKISNNLDKVFKVNDETNIKEEREKWWKENKNDIWNSMMCTYMKEKKDNKCPNHDNIHEVPQMFRWFREWGTYVCQEISNNREILKSGCKNSINGIPSNYCKSLFKDYENVINSKRSEWEIFVKHFDRKKSGYIAANGSTPETYLKEKCPECDCAKINLNDIFQKEYNIQSLLKELIDPQTSGSVSTNISAVVQPTGEENTEQRSVSRTQEQQQPQEQEQPQRQPQNIQRANNNDNILGWEFGPVADPGTNPYISSAEKNSLELINLTSWDKEDIIKQNEDVKEEFEEEQAQEELQQEEIEEELNELQEELQEEQEQLEEQVEEEDKSNKEEGEQEKKTDDEEKEETIESSDDKNAHQSLSIGYKNNNETKKDAEAIMKDLFSLFKEKNTFEDLLKDLTGDLASLFQKQ